MASASNAIITKVIITFKARQNAVSGNPAGAEYAGLCDPCKNWGPNSGGAGGFPKDWDFTVDGNARTSPWSQAYTGPADYVHTIEFKPPKDSTGYEVGCLAHWMVSLCMPSDFTVYLYNGASLILSKNLNSADALNVRCKDWDN